MVLAAGGTADRISFGNTIKKSSDIAGAYARGVRLFAFDSRAELEKIAVAAPGSRVFCRILTSGEGAEWPLSRKFGCEPAMALRAAARWPRTWTWCRGASPSTSARSSAIRSSGTGLSPKRRELFRDLEEDGVELGMLNIGGGFPARYRRDIPTLCRYGACIRRSILKHFGNRVPDVIVEPGRQMVGNAGIIQTEVVLIAKKSANDQRRWVFLDIGKFGGLAETEGEAIQYPIKSPRRGRAERVDSRRPDLRFRRRAVREGELPAAGRSCRSATVCRSARPARTPRPMRRLPSMASSRYAATASEAPTTMIQIEPEPPGIASSREALLDQAFGPARLAKTAERLREGRLPAAGLSFVAEDAGKLVGTIRFWHLRIGGGLDALLLGPAGGGARVTADGASAQRLIRARSRLRRNGSAIRPCCSSATSLLPALRVPRRPHPPYGATRSGRPPPLSRARACVRARWRERAASSVRLACTIRLAGFAPLDAMRLRARSSRRRA